MQRERIVAVGLLTQRDVDLLGSTFDRLWPVEEGGGAAEGLPDFAELLRAIDAADEELRRPVEADAMR